MPLAGQGVHRQQAPACVAGSAASGVHAPQQHVFQGQVLTAATQQIISSRCASAWGCQEAITFGLSKACMRLASKCGLASFLCLCLHLALCLCICCDLYMHQACVRPAQDAEHHASRGTTWSFGARVSSIQPILFPHTADGPTGCIPRGAAGSQLTQPQVCPLCKHGHGVVHNLHVDVHCTRPRSSCGWSLPCWLYVGLCVCQGLTAAQLSAAA